MANYNYRTNDYMRRSQCVRQPVNTPVRTEPKRSACVNDCADNCCPHDLLKEMPLAMAYVPWQEWRNVYSAEKALCRGTIFEDLDKPFLGIGGCHK